MRARTIAFQKRDPEVEGTGKISVVRGDPGVTIALVEYNKADEECADALYRINKRLYPNEPEENA